MANGSQKQADELVPRDTLVFEEGQPGHNMYFILDGKVEIFRGEGDDKKVLAVLSKGEFFGELALIDAQPRIAGAAIVAMRMLTSWLAAWTLAFWLTGAACVGAAGADDGADLLAAARHGDTAAVVALLDAGADVDSRDNGRWTPLVWAAAYLHEDTARVLIENGADLEAIGRAGKNSGTALMWAAKKPGSRAMVTLLLDAGAKVDGTDQYGRTALMLAARHGRAGSIRLLLDAGADINAVNDLPRVRTALETAQKYRGRRIVRLLREAGAKDWADLPPDRIATWRATRQAAE